jgi:hypothetical protein
MRPHLFFLNGRWKVRRTNTAGMRGHKLRSRRERNRKASYWAWLWNIDMEITCARQS